MSETAGQRWRAARRSGCEFIAEWLKNWWGLMGCAAFTFLGIYAAAANKSNVWVVGASAAAGTVMFFIASFQAWRREHEASNNASERISRLETALQGGDPLCIPPAIHCIQKPATFHQRATAGEYSTEFIVSRFIGVAAKEIHLQFTWPAASLLVRVTEATYHTSVEAQHNSRMPAWKPRGLYGCTVFLQDPPTERTIITLYTTSEEPLQLVCVDASGR
jgi:hypothetical protein